MKTEKEGRKKKREKERGTREREDDCEKVVKGWGKRERGRKEEPACEGERAEGDVDDDGVQGPL